jgi:hypothetical protein
MKPPKSPRIVVQLRVELARVTPAVWRRLLVPGGATLAKLHRIVQASMGWSEAHPYAFRVGGTVYGDLDDDDLDDDLDEEDGEGDGDGASLTVLEALRALDDHDEILYEYDFGDGWEHTIAAEDVRPQSNALKFAICLGGEGACPPEDVGGPEGYRAFLVAVGDPGHEDHDELVEWFGGPFDPTRFDIAEVNVALQMIR